LDVFISSKEEGGLSMKALAKKLISIFGYEITRKPSGKVDYSYGFEQEQEAREAIAIVRKNTMVSYKPLITLFQQVRHCEINSINGDYVECGVWKGGAVGLMALANIKYRQKRRDIHIFDIFSDICEPDPAIDGEFTIRQVAELAGVDKRSLKGRLKPVKGVYDSHGGPGTVKIVRKLLEDKIGYDKNFLHYHKGWFQNTLPDVAKEINKIAILRLDADLYASTKICLDYLYEKVVSGGFLIIDDYGTYEGCKRAVDEFREKKGIRSFLNHVNQDCRYWIKE
jgi:O-methyltransferase